MNGTAAHLRERLRTGYWLVPGGMVAVYLGLAALMLYADEVRPDLLVSMLSLLAVPGAEGSRSVLAAIAGSMVTVAATVFSITMLTLSSASQQFGPRVLRNFMRDRWNQVTLGTFTGTFAYALIVLRTAGRKHGGEFVPNLSVSFALVLAIVAVVVLVLFIHHVSVLIQAPQIVAKVGVELERAIDELFPDDLGEEARADEPLERPGGPARACCFSKPGYIDAVGDSALRVAAEHGLVIELLAKPGDFVLAGQASARVWPLDRASDEIARKVTGVFILSRARTPAQDPGFSLGQLTEIAARALSSGINDPFTACVCIDYLGSALARLAGRKLPSRVRKDGTGRGTLIAPRSDFEDLLGLACDPLHEYGSSHRVVVLHLAGMLARVAESVRRPGDHAAVLRHLARLRYNAERHLSPIAGWAEVRQDLDAATARAAAAGRQNLDA